MKTTDLTRLAARCPVSPNTITALALALNLVAAGLLYTRHFFIAIAFVAAGGLLDALDGAVARAQNRATRLGDFLDHFFDRVSDSAIVAGWTIGAAARIELAAGAIITVMLNGYIGTQIEATYGHRTYATIGRLEFVLALIAFPILSSFVDIANWLALAIIVFALVGIAQRLVLAARLERSR